MLDNVLSLQAETQAPGYFSAFTEADARRITAPTLLLAGEYSPRMFHLIVDQLAHCLPFAEYVVVPKAGHAMNADNPEVYNASVLNFLAGQPSRLQGGS